MKAISLFSGVGMFDLGVALAGYDIVAQVEIDNYCRKVLKRHAASYWPNSKQFTDVCSFGRHDITGRIDLIYGGFPCQPHSIAGSRKGAADSRNLWPEFKRIIGEIRPRAVLLENVAGITQAYEVEGQLRAAYALTVIADLTDLGYVCRWGIISAADAGAPHQRERWWCVAYANGVGRNRQTARKPTSHKHGKHTPHKRGGSNVIHEIESGRKTMAYSPTSGLSNRERPGIRPYKTQALGRLGYQRLKRQCKTLGYARRAGLQKRHITTKPSTPGYNSGQFNITRRKRRIKPGMGRTADGIASRVDELRWPAGQDIHQYEWEAPRTVPSQEATHRTPRIKALGNGGMWMIVYELAKAIRAYQIQRSKPALVIQLSSLSDAA